MENIRLNENKKNTCISKEPCQTLFITTFINYLFNTTLYRKHK